jgi:hypothetical protein
LSRLQPRKEVSKMYARKVTDILGWLFLVLVGVFFIATMIVAVNSPAGW